MAIAYSALLVQIEILPSSTCLFSPPSSSIHHPLLPGRWLGPHHLASFHLCPPDPVFVATDKVTGNLSQISSLLLHPEPSRRKTRCDLAPATFPTHFPLSFLVFECSRLALKSSHLFSLTGVLQSSLLLAACVTHAIVPLPRSSAYPPYSSAIATPMPKRP